MDACQLQEALLAMTQERDKLLAELRSLRPSNNCCYHRNPTVNCPVCEGAFRVEGGNLIKVK